MGRPQSGHSHNRLLSLDLLRGLAVAGMILVTSPGSWDHRYTQLDHAAWFGWTLADMVFPCFLFAVGFALALSLPKTSIDGAWTRIARRCVLLILLGLFLNALPWFDMPHLRIPGILQRIALCYATAAGLVLLSSRRDDEGRLEVNLPVMVAAAAILLVGYWALLSGRLDLEGNLPARVDRALFTVDHLWPYGTAPDGRVVYDPEGLLSTLGALVNVLAGIIAATLVRRGKPIWWLAVAGLALVAAAYALDPLLPINKRLWTSSFALLSSGFAMALLAALWLVPQDGLARVVTIPLRIAGGNAILAFTLSQLMSAFGGLPILAHGQTPQGWGFAMASRLISDPYLASLACASAILALVIALIAPLHRQGVHLRL